MMTSEQRAIFSQILDVNWEWKREKNPVLAFELLASLNNLKAQLRESMGEEAYKTFMDRGTKMFS